MQDVIRLLPDKVANQIAAGEVVQRPASVVKELLENAIDAEASKIQLSIKEAGKNLIQVIDNGKGMSETDARMAFERHSTSKIRNTEDIFHIQTKGFRGEALASISAVSQVELKTKREEDDLGTNIQIEGNEVLSQNPEITADGSNFSIKNLFFNVPARRKFLKSNHVELRHIVDEFLRVALAHPEVHFELIHNEKEVYKLRSNSRVQRIVEIFGNKIRPNLVPVSQDLGWIQIEGFIGKPESAKKTRGEQYFFVNNRYFRSPYFNKAILDAYDGLLPTGYTPSYFMYFTINPEKIDVNIHPSKTEVKFENDSDLYALLRSTVKQSIGIYNVAPSLDFEQDPQWQGDVLTKDKRPQLSAPKVQVNPNYNPFHTSSPTPPTPKENIEIAALYQSNLSKEETDSKMEAFSELTAIPMRLTTGYWLVEYENQIFIFHPYRVHQSVLYERFPRNKNNSAISQQLLFPIEFPLDERQKVVLNAIEKPLFDLGFEWTNTSDFLSVTAIPQHLISDNIIQLFDAVLEEAQWHGDEQFMEYFNQKAAMVSAQKRSQWQHPHEVAELWQSFVDIGLPKYSPLQKPNYNSLSLEESIKPLEA